MKNLAVLIFLCSLMIAFSKVTKAEVNPTSQDIKLGAGSSEDLQVKVKARKRIYPGGRDEESLRVQPQLVPPSRKMGPATEAPEPGSTTPADD